ncbi:MAG: class I SAM-dependent methyltransferase [Thermales bacterium]|nr:class I SAM-dependent methyltransferase [Thermales bacterium]
MIRKSLIDYDKKPSFYYTATRIELLPFINDSAKSLLDVGCSTGVFGKLAKEKTSIQKVTGIELNKEEAKTAKTNLDTVYTGTFEDNAKKLKKGGYDIISFNDVLEHLIDPYDMLHRAKPFLSKNGYILASIPNVRYIKNLLKYNFKKDWQYEDLGILDRTHLRFFTKKSMIRMFQECGYEVNRIEGINSIGRTKRMLLSIITFGLISDTYHMQYA